MLRRQNPIHKLRFMSMNQHEKLTASPTVPRPKTATIEPASTFAVFHTAPRPG